MLSIEVTVSDCVAATERVHRAVCVYHLNELFNQLSATVEQTPSAVDSNSNTGIATSYFHRVRKM